MELKSPKTKKKTSIAKLISWSRMFRTPLLILFLLGSTNCDSKDDLETDLMVVSTNSSVQESRFTPVSLRHTRLNDTTREKLGEMKFWRRNLNKEILNFVMIDYLNDGEVEKRVHYNGITAKETSVGDGSGLKLRQLTDGRHLVQVIYAPTGEIQDCEYITQSKSARRFLKILRKELKLALDEETSRLFEKKAHSSEEEQFYRQYRNVSYRLLKNNEKLPRDVASWLDYDKLRTQCLEKHEEMKTLLRNKNTLDDSSVARSRRSLRENFIMPGTKWCGAGQLAEDYTELGSSTSEDRCCRAHDSCRRNIGMFKRKYGYFNFRPFTISHCRCDRRFRACLKLADTSVSNMVGKLFFNVVQTKCFILKKVKACTRRSWWGKCIDKRYTKQAFLRDNLPY